MCNRFDDWALKWLKVYKQGMVKDNSFWGTYHNPVVKHLIPYFGSKLLQDIKPIDVQIFFRTLTNNYSLATQEKIKAALSAIFNCAIENGLCDKNPVTRTLKLKSDVLPVKKEIYTKEQFKQVWNFACNHPFGLSVLILLETGISRSELLGIRYNKDIDLHKSIICINNGTVLQKSTENGKLQVVTKGLKNKYRQRVIPITSFLRERISLKIEQQERNRQSNPQISYFLISSPRGYVYSPDNWYKREYIPFMCDLQKLYPDMPFRRPHELRHTRASFWHDMGLDLLDIAYLGGWCDIEMLRKRYNHISVEELKDRMHLNI